jgi:hypothetical protein
VIKRCRIFYTEYNIVAIPYTEQQLRTGRRAEDNMTGQGLCPFEPGLSPRISQEHKALRGFLSGG